PAGLDPEASDCVCSSLAQDAGSARRAAAHGSLDTEAPSRLGSPLLVEADDVAARIADAGGDLRRVAADRLHQLAAVRDGLLDGGRDAVDHDVEEEAGLAGRRPPSHPGAAHLADAVVEGRLAVAALAQAPAEDGAVELGRPGDVGGGDLDVTD